MRRVPKIGAAITYVDEHGAKRDALVTHVGFDKPNTWINLIIVNDDVAQTDGYGRKIERRSSVPPHSDGWTGNYWTE